MPFISKGLVEGVFAPDTGLHASPSKPTANGTNKTCTSVDHLHRKTQKISTFRAKERKEQWRLQSIRSIIAARPDSPCPRVQPEGLQNLIRRFDSAPAHVATAPQLLATFLLRLQKISASFWCVESIAGSQICDTLIDCEIGATNSRT